MAETAPQKMLSLAEYKLCREYLVLTDSQRKFVLKYFENQDAAESAKVAYPRVKDATRMRNLLMVNPKIRAAIATWYNSSPRDVAIERVEHELRRCRSARTRMELLKILFKLQGLIEDKK